jgi:nicotinamide mononucleotide transporter
MTKLLNILRNEFDLGKNAWLFLLFGLFLQGFVFSVSYNTTLSLISGILGVVSVVLCSKRKISFYAFGIAQIITFLIIVWNDMLWAKVIENTFYLITMIIGVFVWKEHYNTEVERRALNDAQLILMIILVYVSSTLLGFCLSFTSDEHPYIDAFTTVPAFAAQILMMLRYREQWLFWFVIDVGCIILWMIVGNYCMVAQYIFWTINCIYGWYNWK